MDDETPPTRSELREIADELATRNVCEFIRDNFGLYAPPADYAALRAENLRRTRAAQKK